MVILKAEYKEQATVRMSIDEMHAILSSLYNYLEQRGKLSHSVDISLIGNIQLICNICEYANPLMRDIVELEKKLREKAKEKLKELEGK